jgi:formylglycine-generating enzyme required for sulfatase activity
MMSAANVCPARSRLQTLLDGQLAVNEQETVIRHVETCGACQRILDSLTASQSWEDVAAQMRKEDRVPAPALQHVIERAKVATGTDDTEAEEKSTPRGDAPRGEETHDVSGGHRDDDNLAFLVPSSRPGALGRLGHYEILEVIGKGGFGTVLKGFDAKLHRMVAIKVLSPELSASGTARQRFIREARAAAAVTHDHLVTIHAVEADHWPPYLVMQLIDVVTLQEKLNRSGTLGLKEILRIGLQMAAGLAAAHKQGLVHRDIKPANVLLENGVERVKITDFGLAKIVDDASVSQSGVVAGTPMYMSPEQAEGLPIDHRSDLFSLGTVLYAMCTGQPPFRASGTHAVLKRVIDASPRPIREVNPEIPDWLCVIIVKLHAKKPEERFQSAKEVAELLAEHLAHLQRPLTAVPTASMIQTRNTAPDDKPSARILRLKLGHWLLIGAATVLLMIIGGIIYVFENRPGDVKPPPRGNTDPPLAVAPFDAAKAREHQDTWAKHLGVDVEVTNSIGMKLRLIPPGKFLMGSAEDDLGRAMYQGPQHGVTLTRSFFMGAHDVTVGQFKAFVKEKDYQTEADKGNGATRLFPGRAWAQDSKANWRNPGYEQTDDHPVVCVSWNDARAFCDWLSAREHKTYALPTEAQWEYGCRAGSATTYYFGDDAKELEHYAWYLVNAESKAHPVGQLKPNAWGLFDMHGNAWQWTADWFAPDYYLKSPENDPPGAAAGVTRILRGGGWADSTAHCNNLFRNRAHAPSERYSHFGFRVVLVGDLKRAFDMTGDQ